MSVVTNTISSSEESKIIDDTLKMSTNNLDLSRFNSKNNYVLPNFIESRRSSLTCETRIDIPSYSPQINTSRCSPGVVTPQYSLQSDTPPLSPSGIASSINFYSYRNSIQYDLNSTKETKCFNQCTKLNIDTDDKKLWPNPITPFRQSINIPNLTLLGYITKMDDNKIYVWNKRSEKIINFLTLLSAIITIIAVLSLNGIIASQYVWFLPIFIYPLFIIRFMFINLYLTKRLLRCFETWFLIVNITIGIVIFFDLFEWDIRCMYVGTTGVLWMSYLFHDALVIPSRKRIILTIIAIIITIFPLIVLYTGLWNFRPRIIYIGNFLVLKTEDIFLQRSLTILFFQIRHLIIAIRYPNCFTVLTCRLTR
jgi:hypothetical protein